MDCDTKKQVKKIVEKEMAEHKKIAKIAITAFLSGVLFFCVTVIFTILVAAPIFL